MTHEGFEHRPFISNSALADTNEGDARSLRRRACTRPTIAFKKRLAHAKKLGGLFGRYQFVSHESDTSNRTLVTLMVNN